MLSAIDHKETSVKASVLEMGDTQGESSTESVRNTVGDDLYRETIDNRGAVGRFATNI